MKLKTIRASVKKMREFDPGTVLNVNMLNRMIDDGQISYEWHGNRKIIDYDVLVQRLNTLFELDCTGIRPPHVRSIDGALKEAKETLPELGVSEERLRDLIKTGIVASIRVGNRSYIPMELFHAPYDKRLAKDCYRIAERTGSHYRQRSYADEQLDELLSRQARAAKVKRIG